MEAKCVEILSTTDGKRCTTLLFQRTWKTYRNKVLYITHASVWTKHQGHFLIWCSPIHYSLTNYHSWWINTCDSVNKNWTVIECITSLPAGIHWWKRMKLSVVQHFQSNVGHDTLQLVLLCCTHLHCIVLEESAILWVMAKNISLILQENNKRRAGIVLHREMVFII